MDTLKKASPIWKAIESTKSIITKGACYMIGDGKSVDVWLDPWVPWIQGFIPSPRTGSPSITPLPASQLINYEFHCWKAPLIHEIFSPQDARAILSTLIPIKPRPNKLVWIPNSKGCFSVKAAYQQVVNQVTTTPLLRI